MHDNPFESPQTIAPPHPYVPEKRSTELPIASSNRRFFNLILDTVFYLIFSAFVGVFLGLTGMYEAIEDLPPQVFGILLMLLYYVPQEIMWGRTLAKFITGTRVVNEKGGPPTPGQVFGRTFARLIPFEVFSFFGSHPVGWHDKLSKTRVIHER